jgi:hypothetical protein
MSTSRGATRSLRCLTTAPYNRPPAVGTAEVVYGHQVVTVRRRMIGPLMFRRCGRGLPRPVPFSIVVPAAALAPLLTEHVPDRLDSRAGENARILEAEAAWRYLQRLAALHADLVQAAVSSDRYEVRRAVEVGHHQLFDTADLLERHDSRSASSALIVRERLMLQFAVQTRQIVTPTQGDAPSSSQRDRFGGQPLLGPYPSRPSRRPQPSAEHTIPVPPT